MTRWSAQRRAGRVSRWKTSHATLASEQPAKRWMDEKTKRRMVARLALPPPGRGLRSHPPLHSVSRSHRRERAGCAPLPRYGGLVVTRHRVFHTLDPARGQPLGTLLGTSPQTPAGFCRSAVPQRRNGQAGQGRCPRRPRQGPAPGPRPALVRPRARPRIPHVLAMSRPLCGGTP